MYIFCCFHEVSPGFSIVGVFPLRFVLDVEAHLFTKCYYVCVYDVILNPRSWYTEVLPWGRCSNGIFGLVEFLEIAFNVRTYWGIF